MRNKKYKIGDRIFFECFDGTIESKRVIDIEDDYYVDDNGKRKDFQCLIVWKNGKCSSGIEDYNCLSPSNPKVRKLAREFSKFDAQVDKILESINNLLSPYNNAIKKEVIEYFNNIYDIN